MGQFIAILKDSFREAVDGFVIYLMLALSLLMIVILASVSYVAESPADAIPKVLPLFQIVFPDKGLSTAPTGVPVPYEYRAAEVQDVTNGAKFVLEVGPPKPKDKDPDDKGPAAEPTKPDPNALDAFRYAVYTWREPAGEKIKNPFGQGGRGKQGRNAKTDLEFVTPPRATPGDLRGVTDEEMTAFVKYQFVTFVGIDDVKVTRKAGVQEPEYKFDVEIRGVSGARGWPHAIYVFFGAVPPLKGIPLGLALHTIQDQVFNGIGAAVALIISVVITSFFIPNLLRKGSVDLLISKPIGRVQLLVYKYVGGLTFIFLVTGFTIGGSWLVMAMRSGHWDPAFLMVIPVLTFTFAILYAVSTLVAVFTRSAIASIMITLGFMFFLWLFGQVKGFFDANKVVQVAELPEWSYTLVDGLNNILPRYKDLDRLITKLIVDSTRTTGEARLAGLFTEYPSWGGAVGVSLAFIAAMLALASWRFSKRDY